jgi:hypothetical protein
MPSGRVVFEGLEDGAAAHAGQPDIQQNGIGQLLLGQHQAGLSAVSDNGLEPLGAAMF